MRHHRIGTWALSLLVVGGVLGMSATSGGQDEPDPPRFGAADLHYKSVSSIAFTPAFPQMTWSYARPNSDERSCDSAIDGTVFDYGIDLPSGVLLEAMSWVLANEAPVGDITTSFCKQAWDEALGGGRSCRVFSVPPGPGAQRPTQVVNEVIDNAAFSYRVAINLNNCAPLFAFRQMRLEYRYQVSPAPAVATFGDVPLGHPQRQYIEALVASGITAGCGGGNYCPDQPLTRGQMAVFLSKGLGLHFAP